MNPEAGLLQSPFRLAVERVADAHPLMKWQEVHRMAQSADLTAESHFQPEPVATRELVQEELF